MMHALIEKINAWDMGVFLSVFRDRESAVMARCMRAVSATGDGYLYPLIVAGLFVCAPAQAMSFLISACVAFALELPAYRIVKQKIKRNRPYQSMPNIHNRVIPADQFSFPSGHTAAACVMAVLLGHFFPWATVSAYVWVLLIGMSRVYLGVHYPSDILAGMVLGFGCALAGLCVIA
jgi:undecaprenyl-diphosphatase